MTARECCDLITLDCITLLLLQVECKGDLTEEVVIAKLRASGGAHQPTRYEFSNFSS